MYKTTPTRRARLIAELARTLADTPTGEIEVLVKAALERSFKVGEHTGERSDYASVLDRLRQIRTLLVPGRVTEAYLCCVHDQTWDPLTRRVYFSPRTPYEEDLAAVLWEAIHDTALSVIPNMPFTQQDGEFMGYAAYNLIELLGYNCERALRDHLVAHLKQYEPHHAQYNHAQDILERMGETAGIRTVS